MSTLIQDLRYGIRMLVKNPGFTAVAVITLALGIGANTAIFSVVNALLLSPLPYSDSDRLALLWESMPTMPLRPVSYLDYLDWKAQNHVFTQMAAFHWADFSLTGLGPAENVKAGEVTANFLTTLGVRPLLGRDLVESDDKPGVHPVALVSYGFWQKHFGGEPQALGKTVALDDRDFTVVGVLPPRFRIYVIEPEIYLPLGLWASQMNLRGHAENMAVLARLGPGVTLADARAQMAVISARLAHQYPGSNSNTAARVDSLREFLVGDIRPAVLVLFGAVGFVLLIACTNVANLLLARATVRTKEIAIRAAMGAGRWRVFRQLLTESTLLGGLGGGFGLLFGGWGVSGVKTLIPPHLQSSLDLRLDHRVLAFVGIVSLLTGIVFGLVPAFQASKCQLNETLKEGGRTSASASDRHYFRDGLVISEVALAMVLLMSAGLIILSLHRLLNVDPGFDPNHVLYTYLKLRGPKYADDPRVKAFWQQTLERVRALPGVKAVAVASNIPLTDDHSITSVTLQGVPTPPPGKQPQADYHEISPGYFAVMRIPLLEGRPLQETDTDTSPAVALISQTMARRVWPNQDPIGKQFKGPRDGPWTTVVGVVGDTHQYGLDAAVGAEYYVPYLQSVDRSMGLLVRTASDSLLLTSSVRHEILSVDQDEPVGNVKTMNQVVSESVSTRRMTRALLGLFGALAVLLAAVGLYGVISYSAERRTHEIGIRMALGARREDVLKLVVGQGFKLILAGVGIGIAGALVLTRFLLTLLYGVKPADPVTFISAAILLTVVALFACYIPARRATKVDPVEALRYE